MGSFEKTSFVQPVDSLSTVGFGLDVSNVDLHFVGYEVRDGKAVACQWDLATLKTLSLF